MAPRIMLIGNETCRIEAMGLTVKYAGYELASAVQSGDDIINPVLADVVFIDIELQDMSALKVLDALQCRQRVPACVIVGACFTPDFMVKAVRLGAIDFLIRPAAQHDILAAIERCLSRRERDLCARAAGSADTEAHAVAPVVDAGMRFLGSRRDARTLKQFSLMAAVSVGGFRNWCRSAGLKARQCLSFFRLLRAVYLCERDRSLRPETLLMLTDPRTQSKTLWRAGCRTGTLRPDVAYYLDHQQFVTDPDFLRTVRRRLLIMGVLPTVTVQGV